MGLPLVSRAGKTEVSNISTRILTELGKQKWIAKDYDEYIEIASSIAADPDQLKLLRKSLRQEVENSSIMDYESHAKRIENALLEGWKLTCDRYRD
jgi:predicted O-linked N-acetylglucosamine transferase (SPINDLY family)